MTDTVHPFTIDVPQADLDDLADRLARTRWGVPLPGPAWERGIPVEEVKELARYWAEGYDWRAQEARLNELPQFTTDADGQTVHFAHVRSAEPGALPLLLVHGWPGSFAEFVDVVGPLTDPKAHGGDSADAFHVVVPSIPGFGFSGPLAGRGWDSKRVASTFAQVMARLGYNSYGAQGGDLGAMIVPDLGRVDPDHVVGLHVNAATAGFIPFGELPPDEIASLTDVERERLGRIRHFLTEDNGYFQVSATRPQTIAHALTDSPVGQLAWVAEKFHEWTDRKAGLAPDVLLTHVMQYWLTGTAGSAANLYYENMHSGNWPTPSGVPTGVAVFAQDIAIRRYAERTNTITHWSDFTAGGHFAATEAPEAFVGDVRGFFAGLR
jgi:pimeloyl-ACP methyl ester carboxylesterase